MIWTVKSCGDRLDKSFRMAVCSVYNAKHTNARYRVLTQKCVELQLITTFLFRKKAWVIVSIWWWQPQTESLKRVRQKLIKCVFSVKSQFWVENFKLALLIIIEWWRKTIQRESEFNSVLVQAAGFHQSSTISMEYCQYCCFEEWRSEKSGWPRNEVHERVYDNKMLMGWHGQNYERIRTFPERCDSSLVGAGM